MFTELFIACMSQHIILDLDYKTFGKRLFPIDSNIKVFDSYIKGTKT